VAWTRPSHPFMFIARYAWKVHLEKDVKPICLQFAFHNRVRSCWPDASSTTVEDLSLIARCCQFSASFRSLFLALLSCLTRCFFSIGGDSSTAPRTLAALSYGRTDPCFRRLFPSERWIFRLRRCNTKRLTPGVVSVQMVLTSLGDEY
jgi:hypothetical protein